MNQLKEKWMTKVVPTLIKELGYKQVMEVPKLEKIVINIGVGDAITNSKFLESSLRELELITGQKPVITKAKKSIAGFKIRAGNPIGCKVTLRGDNMYVFLDKLINIILPRVRDFWGLSAKSFDGRGNYAMGISDQYIFPEINYDDVVKARGLDIVIVTTAKTDTEAYRLLKEMGLPFKREPK